MPRPAMDALSTTLLEEYALFLHRRNYARGSIRNYLCAVRRFLVFFPTLDLNHTTTEHIERYVFGRPLSPRSINGEVETLRPFFKWLWKHKRICRTNPCQGFERPRWKPRRRPHPNTEEFRRLRVATRTLEEACLVELLYFAGPRIAEVRSLRTRDLDLVTRRVKILGKGHKERVAVFPERTAVLLREFTVSRTPHSWLFPGRNGHPRGLAWLGRTLKHLGQDAGLPYKVTAHTLRHGFFRLMKTSGVPIEVAARLGGHEDIHTTARMYGQMDEADLQTAYDRHVDSVGEISS